MKFNVVGIESLSRTNKTTGQTSNGIQLYLTFPTNNVVGCAVRQEYIGENSPAYPALRQMLATNINGLIGAIVNLDYALSPYIATS